MGAVRPAEAVRLWVQYVRRSRERSQYVSRRQYGRGDSTSVGGSTAAEPVRQSEAVRPSGTVRQLDLCGAVGLAAVDGDASRGNASVCLKSSPVKSCDEGREAAQDKDSRRLRERRRWRFEAKTVDGSFAQRQGRRHGWYAWTGTVPLLWKGRRYGRLSLPSEPTTSCQPASPPATLKLDGERAHLKACV